MAKTRKKAVAGPVVGLDIGSKWIKAVEIKPGKNGISLTGIGYEPTPEGAVGEDFFNDPAAIASAVRNLLSSSGISAKKVVSAVSGQSSVVVRIIEVPKMAANELVETMKWEVERHIPFPSSEVVMDFRPLNRKSVPPDAQTMEVLLAVCQKDVVGKHMEVLQGAKLTPLAIEVEALALPRALIDANPDMEGLDTVAIVDIGGESTNFCIYEDKTLVFPRRVPIAAINLIRAIVEATGMDEEAAEAALREQGAVDINLMNQAAGMDYDAGQLADQTQYGGGYGAYVEQPGEEAEEPPRPPVSGFDLGDEFYEPPAPPPLEPLDEPPSSSVFGAEPDEERRSVFDLDDDGSFEKPSSTASTVFDLNAELKQPVADFSEQAAAAETPSASVNPVVEAIAPVLAELAAEISRSLDYFAQRNPSPAKAVILSGGVAKLPGLAAYLESVLETPVRVADPLARVNNESKRFSPEYLSEIAPVFSNCLGLALRDYVEADS